MNEFISYLNSNNGLFSLIFSFLVALSTIVYAILTGFLVNETKKLGKIQTEPKIQIILETFEDAVNLIKLNIKNIGQGPALNINFEPIVISGGKNGEDILHEFSSVKAFSSGLNYLGPSHYFNTSYYNVLDMNKKEDLYDIIIRIEIKYESITKEKYNDTIMIDFRELEGTYRGKPHLYSIAHSLEKIEKTLNKIISDNRMKVDVYNSTDRDIQEKERIEMFKKYSDKNNADEK